MIDFEVTPDGGEAYKVTADMRDIRRFELTYKDFGISLADRPALGNLKNPTATMLYPIAYIASKRKNLYAGEFATFADTCDVMPIEDTTPDPTPPEVSPDQLSG